MEDLWKVKSLDWQVDELADSAVYRTLLRRYHDEEVINNTRHLLYPNENQTTPEKPAGT